MNHELNLEPSRKIIQDWPEIITRSRLFGLTKALALNLIPVSFDGENLLMHAPPEHAQFVTAHIVKRINEVVNEECRRGVSLQIEILPKGPEAEKPRVSKAEYLAARLAGTSLALASLAELYRAHKLPRGPALIAAEAELSLNGYHYE